MITVATQSAAISTVLGRLRSALGTKEEPDGSNYNFIVQWYNDNVDRIGNGAWCQMTQTWALWTAGFKDLFTPGTAWTVQAARNAIAHQNGMVWHEYTAGVKPGDLVYYDWSGSGQVNNIDHVGMVEKVNDDGTLYVLEGNASNQLRRIHRDAKYIVGYIRLDWARVVKTPATPTPTPQPPASKPDQTAQQIKVIQGLVHVPTDGVWGPVTDAAFLAWRKAKSATKGQIQLLQKTLGGGLAQDGIWGPLTDNAVLVFRKQHLVK